MIVVTVELLSARTHASKIIGRAIIANDGQSANPMLQDYDICVANKRDASKVEGLRLTMENPLRTGRVENYPSKSYNMWRLVIRALRSAFPEER